MCVCLVGLVLWWCFVVLFLFYFYSVLSLHSILPQAMMKISERFRERLQFYIAHDNEYVTLGRAPACPLCICRM